MSRSSRKRRKRSGAGARPSSRSGSGGLADLGSYVAFVLIWVFASFLLYISARDAAPLLSTALVAAFFWYVVWCSIGAYTGRPLYKWQRGLVRGPLVVLGGAREPVASVKGRASGRNAIVVAAVAALLVTLVLVWVANR